MDARYRGAAAIERSALRVERRFFLSGAMAPRPRPIA